jgi:hypothetical protein
LKVNVVAPQLLLKLGSGSAVNAVMETLPTSFFGDLKLPEKLIVGWVVPM